MVGAGYFKGVFMANVTINGQEYDSLYPSRRFAAFADHGVQLDREGNVRVASLVGLVIRTTGTVTVDKNVPAKPTPFGGADPNEAAEQIYNDIDRAGRGE